MPHRIVVELTGLETETEARNLVIEAMEKRGYFPPGADERHYWPRHVKSLSRYLAGTNQTPSSEKLEKASEAIAGAYDVIQAIVKGSTDVEDSELTHCGRNKL